MSDKSNHEFLHKIIDDLLAKKRVNRVAFFEALNIVHNIAADCQVATESSIETVRTFLERYDRLAQTNAILKRSNIELAWAINKLTHDENTLNH